MDTRHLRCFLKIAETGSITRAADALGLAQPSLSQQLLRLEDEVGTALFRRTARGVALTEAGRVFEGHARQLLRAADQALDEVRQLSGEPSGSTALALPSSLARIVGDPLADAVLARAPGVSLRLVEGFSDHITQWLEQGSVDLGILYDMGQLGHLSVTPLARGELWLIGPPGRFADPPGAQSLPVEEIAEMPLILPSARHGLRQAVEREAAAQGIALNYGPEIESLSQIGNLVTRGQGFTILPLPAVADDLKAGRLSAARIGRGAIARTLCIARNPARPLTHASLRVDELAVKIVARLAAKGEWIGKL